MIISRKHNFIFIKTKKTAGSSMEIALSSHAGPDDIVTPLGNIEEIERNKLWPQVFPQNFLADTAMEQRYRDAIKTADRRTVKAMYKEVARSGDGMIVGRHGAAWRAKEAVGDAFWNQAFKFTIERHPYEKAVSLAWFELRRRSTFDAQLESVLQGKRYRNFDLYAIDDTPVVDFIIRHEHLAEDLAKVEERLGGLALAARMPRSNSRQRKDRRPAREILNDAQKAIVRETCREEFELMGYAH